MDLNEHFVPKNFSIRPGTVDYGKEYEVKMAALLSLRCVVYKKIHGMWLAMNVDECGAFDDLILHIQTDEGKKITYLIQLKHQMEPSNIGAREFKTKKDFLLDKYYNTITQIKNEADKTETTNLEIINHFRSNLETIVFILYTNRGTTENDFLKSVIKKSALDDTWLLSELIDTSGTISLFDYDKLDFKLENHVRSCMERFFLFTNQIHINKLDAAIEVAVENLIKPLNLQKKLLKEAVQRYIQFITEWSKGELGGFYPLTKNLMFKVLLQHMITPYMIKWHKYDHLVCDNIWNKIMEKYTLTITRFDDVVLQFLRGYINGEIKNYCEKSENKNLWKRHPDLVSKQLLRTTRRSKEIRRCDAYECLWKLGMVPLLLRVSNSEDFNNVLHLQALFENTFRVVLLLKGEVYLPNKHLKLKNLKNIEDLNPEQRLNILKYPVQLQDRSSVKLLDIVNEDRLQFITVKDIIYILSGKFNIGNKSTPLPEEFIERSLEKVWLHPKVLQEVSSDVFVVKCNRFCDFNIFLFKQQLDFNDNQVLQWNNIKRSLDYSTIRIIKVSDETDLEHLYLTNSKIVHYLILHDVDSLEWVKSTGTIKNIIKFRKSLSVKDLEHKPTHKVIKDSIHKTILISACPGMGKSILMDYIALNASTDFWIFKINLFDYVDYYKNENFEKLEPSEHLQYFFNQTLKGQKCEYILVKAVFQKYLDSKKILLLFDGYDEIPMSCQENASKMIKSFHNLNYYNIYVTTRPILKIHLEELLDTFAVSINSFNKIDQSTFLTKYYLSACSLLDKKSKNVQQCVEEYVDKLLNATKRNLNDQDQEFTGVPLQTKLLAEVFVEGCKKYVEMEYFEDVHFDLLYLYKHFIDQKFKIVCAKFGNSSDDMLHHYRTYRSFYALRLLFSKQDLELINLDERLKQIMQFFPDTLQLIQKDGIVIAEKESNVTFVHRTFAEYLSAQWLSENINTENRETVKILIKRTFDPNFATVRNIFDRILAKGCPLHLAIINRQLDVAKQLIISNETNLTQTDKAKRSFLHLIAGWGVYHPRHGIESIREIQFLHQMVVKDSMIEMLKLIPNRRLKCCKDDLLHYTELDYAILSGSLNIADAICVRIENVNDSITLTDIDIKYSFYFKHFPYGALGSILIRHSITAEVNNIIQERKVSNNKEDELHNEIMNGDVIKASLLLSLGKDINKKDVSGFTPLHVATISGQTLIIQLLLSNGADITESDNSGKTSLHWAIIVGELKIIALLISKGIDINDIDNNGMNSLHYAVVSNSVHTTEIITLLLNCNANITLQDNYGKTPLHYALHYNQIDILKLLLTRGVNIAIINEQSPTTSQDDSKNYDYLSEVLASKDADGGTVLHWAADKGFTDIVSLFLDYGALVEIEDNDGRTALHWAAERGHNDVITLLLSHGANIDAKDNAGRTPIFFAADNSNIETIKLFRMKGASLNDVDNLGRTPLLQAMAKDFEEAIITLLSDGSCLNVKDSESTNPLHWAAWNGNKYIANLLLSQEQTVFLEEQNSDGRTPLILAAFNGHSALIDLLLQKGAKIEATDKQGMNSLHWACWNGHLNAVESLLLKTENLEAKDNNKRSPLICAAYNGHTDIVSLLLQKGANVESRDDQSVTALNWAAYNDHVNTVTLLISNSDPKLEASSNNGRTALINAAHNGNMFIVKTLLAKGANIEAVDNEGMNALHCAVCRGHVDVVKLLLEKGANFEAKSKYEKTPLIYAADFGYTTTVILLLSQGADMEAKDNESMSVLNWAAHNGHIDIVNLLLSFGVNTEIKNGHGRTALICAAQNLHKEVVRSLISKKANMYAQDNAGVGAIHWAAYNGSIDIVNLFLDNGMPLDLKDGDNRTPLIHAAYNGHQNLVTELLCKGARIDDTDVEDMTALHWAILNGHKEVVNLLLTNGANLEKNANENKTALHFATLKGYTNIVDVLLSRGANVEAKDDGGRTVLMYSATRGDVATSALFIRRGANIHVQDAEGLTALDWAKRNNKKSTELFLLQQISGSSSTSN